MADPDDDRGARTEAPTPRRRKEAREKGQVALSVELVAAVSLALWLGGLALGGGAIASALGEAIERSVSALPALGARELAPRDVAALAASLASDAALPLAAVAVPLVLAGWLAAFGQVGFLVAPAAVAPDAARIDPARGLRRIFGARSAARVAFALGKLAAIAAALGAVAWASLPEIASLADAELGPALALLGHVALRAACAGLAVAMAFGIADFFWQRSRHERDLRMTRAELREDLRASEGDPHVRARVRRVQREMARRRMLEEVPRATVVITNPTHYAVALRYDRGETGADGRERAPRVVAKGVDHAARRIREVARDARVPLREDPPLARALHARCAVGDEIPADLFRAVAAALAYVYRVRGELEAAR